MQRPRHDVASAEGDRFEFGESWSCFLAALDDERIVRAEKSLREMLGVESLSGTTFLDAGRGSGAWGVLHHTGAMWRALGDVALLVAPGGSLFIAIYNDQGWLRDKGFRLREMRTCRGRNEFVFVRDVVR
jgi:hypothetical protein